MQAPYRAPCIRSRVSRVRVLVVFRTSKAWIVSRHPALEPTIQQLLQVMHGI